nr:hypothetical protein [Tanacetum cinerariifolium]
MILESVENGPLLWPTVEENGATNIILQGLPPEVYALVSTHKVEKELWERTQMLMQVRDLHTTYVDQLHAYLGQHEYHANEVRLMHEHTSDPLALVVNHQMNKSPYQPHQQSYHQHQFQPQVSIFQSSQHGTPYHSSQYASQAPSSTPLSITYPANDFKSSINHNVYNPSSSIPQVKYAPTVHQQSEFSQPDTGLVVSVFQKGDDPIDAINYMMSFLTTVVTSRYPTTNNQLRTSSNPYQQATINNGRRVIVCYNCKGEGYMSKQCTKPKRKRDEAWFKDKIALMVNLSHYGSNNLAGYMNESQYITVQNSSSPAQQDDLILSVIEQLKTQVINCTKINQENINVNEFLTAELERYKDQFFYDHSTRQALGFQNPCYLKRASQLEPKLYDGNVIQKTDAILIRDSEETLMLEDESHSKMLQKQKDPMMSEKKVNTKPVDYAALNQLSKDFETRFIPQTELSVEQAFWLVFSEF